MALLDDFQQQIDRRLDELRPAFTEYTSLQQLRSAIANLDPEAAAAQVRQFPYPVGPGVGGNGDTAANGTPATNLSPNPVEAAAADRPSNPPRRRKPARAKEASGPVPPDMAVQYEQAALELVASKPGLTAVQLAERMDVPASVLFRLLPTLQRDGRIRKQGKGYLPN